MSRYQSLIVIAVGFAVSTVGLYAKDKHPKTAEAPQDEIEVVGHVVATDGPVTRFFSTQHYRRNYLYAEHESGKTVTLIDVTKIDHPTVLAGVAYPANGTSSDNLVAVTGNAALVTSASVPAATQPQAIRIMSFADPAHPTVKQEFKGVTAISRDEHRGLIFLANADGVWILQQHQAMDPEFVKEWEHMMLDAR